MTEQIKPIEVGVNYFRVLEAIRQIGYRPEEAIMDIVDNSVTAGAGKITIELVAKDAVLTSKNSSLYYRIYDDGEGMNPAQIQEAFRLGGNPKKYAKNSLSKFGMGLKSAGLSIGDSITVISKTKSDKKPTGYILSAKTIEKENKWVITELSSTDLSSYEEAFKLALNGKDSGTLVQISEMRKENHSSISRTERKLNLQIAVVYNKFLMKGLKIELRLIKSNHELIESIEISPVDPTCYAESKEVKPMDWVPDAPAVLIKKSNKRLTSLDADIKGEIALTLLPKPKLITGLGYVPSAKKYADLGVGPLENIGMYIYRNERLISWGDDLDEIFRRHGAFAGVRGSLEITSELDSFFNINVKKSSIVLSDDVHGQLAALLKPQLDNVSKYEERYDVLKGQKLGDDPSHSINENLREFNPPSYAPNPGATTPEVEKEKKNLEQKLIDDSKETAERRKEEFKKEIADGAELPPPPKEDYSPNDKFRIQAFISDARKLWEPGLDSSYGSYVVLNNLHQYYRSHLLEALKDDRAKVIIADMFFAMAHAENELKKSYKYPLEDLKKIFDAFIVTVSDVMYSRAGSSLKDE